MIKKEELKKMNKKKIYKDDFIRLIAKRSGGTIVASKKLWGIIEEIFEDCIREEVEIGIRGFVHLDYITIKERLGFDVDKKEYRKHKKTKRIRIKPAGRLKDIATGKRIVNKKEAERRRDIISNGLKSLK